MLFPVDLQPRITARLVLGMILATCRCCFTCVEQPRLSLMPFFPLFQTMKALLKGNFGIRWFSVNLPKTQLTSALVGIEYKQA